MPKIALFVVGGVVAAGVALSLALLLTGHRVLIWEERVREGQTVTLENWGEVRGDSFICRYFTGRAIVANVLYYSPNNFMGRDSCPFLTKQDS